VLHVESLCRELFAHCELSVVDISRYPALAAMEEVWATPTLVLEQPEPRRRFIGDFGNRARVVRALHDALTAAGVAMPKACPRIDSRSLS
jgi:hypothetical protein